METRLLYTGRAILWLMPSPGSKRLGPKPAPEWIEFPLATGERAAYEVSQVRYSGRTEFQLVEIVETRAHGLALFLDGVPQSALADEFIYHEALVHPALIAHPRPGKVLIAGGGEGATLREVLRHPEVERVTMVDIDGELVELARRHLEPMHRGAFDDPRAEVVIGDVLGHLQNRDALYDAIILDLTDPPADRRPAELYGEGLYRAAASRLAEGGIVATQAFSLAPNNLDWFVRIASTLADVFALVRPYRAEVPFFKDTWGFCTASDSRDPAALGPLLVDSSLRARGLADLRFYDGETHAALFALPRYARQAMAAPRP